MALLALGLSLDVGLAGCGGEDPSGGPKATSTATGDASATASPGGDAHVGWQTATVEGAQIQVPSDWELQQRATEVALAPPMETYGLTTGGHIGSQSSGEVDGQAAVDAGAKSIVQSLTVANGHAQRLPDLKVNGAVLYHVRSDNKDQWRDAFGTFHDGHLISVEWFVDKSALDRQKADAMIDPVMETFKLQ